MSDQNTPPPRPEPPAPSHQTAGTLAAIASLVAASVGVAVQLIGDDILTTIPPWVAIAAGAVGTLTTAGLLYVTRRARLPRPKIEVDPSERLQQRINAVNDAFSQANTAFAEAGVLADELRQEIATQQAAHQKLTEEAERQRTLINMDREEAEAVQALILGDTKSDRKRQRLREWAFFLVGLLLAIPLNIASNLIGDQVAPPAAPAPSSVPAQPSATPTR
ncbi:hypothetical protein [Nonomuraea endophytica]|uniref:Uncharacterized protein n=1 Tax=Nonomuraea endophytica TaxID=714136 RepID=A0A7W8AAQ4_9ACTN|nr:hypothetical protein [Nonomuraea endophytica]MBB5081348.1 hypothetical protein [Nonomuraea endophytica]